MMARHYIKKRVVDASLGLAQSPANSLARARFFVILARNFLADTQDMSPQQVQDLRNQMTLKQLQLKEANQRTTLSSSQPGIQ